MAQQIQSTHADDYVVTETIEGMQRLRALDGSGDWFLLNEVKSAFRKPRLRSSGECRSLTRWRGPNVGNVRFRLVRPRFVLDCAREFSDRPAAWWREALHLT